MPSVLEDATRSVRAAELAAIGAGVHAARTANFDRTYTPEAAEKIREAEAALTKAKADAFSDIMDALQESLLQVTAGELDKIAGLLHDFAESEIRDVRHLLLIIDMLKTAQVEVMTAAFGGARTLLDWVLSALNDADLPKLLLDPGGVADTIGMLVDQLYGLPDMTTKARAVAYSEIVDAVFALTLIVPEDLKTIASIVYQHACTVRKDGGNTNEFSYLLLLLLRLTSLLPGRGDVEQSIAEMWSALDEN